MLVIDDEKRKGEESAMPTPSKTGSDGSEESTDLKVQVLTFVCEVCLVL